MTGILGDTNGLLLAEVIGSTLLLKATMVIAVVAMAATLLRRASAATRAAVWNVAIIGLLVLPVAAFVLPSWSPISLAPPENPTAAVEPVSYSTAAFDEDTWVGQPTPRAMMVTTHVSEISNAIGVFGICIWFSVALLLLARLANHHRIALRMCENGVPVPERMRHLGHRCAQDVGLQTSVCIVQSSEVGIPASLGWPRPTVILPADATTWDDDRISAVLTHEFAHIVRRDHVSHLIVEIARAIYWINPLVHLAAARVSVERERACDDVALRAGYSPGGYAGFLLELARSVVGTAQTTASLAVAARSGLAERVRSILSGEKDRSPTRRVMVWLTGLTTILVAIPVATFDAFSQDRASLDQLVEELRSNDARIARRAAWSLGEREDPRAVGALIEQLRVGVPNVRLVSAWALGEIKDPMATEVLIGSLEDEDPLVREMAALALGELERPDVVEVLALAAERDAGMRGAISWALGEIDTEEAWRTRNALNPGRTSTVATNEEVWSGSLTRRRTAPDGEAREMIAQLQAERANDRMLAAWNLGLAGETGAVEALLDTLRDPEPIVRAMAVWALDEINPSRVDP